MISFPKHAVTEQSKREFLLSIVQFVEMNFELLKNSPGGIIEGNENGLESCKAIVDPCSSILECVQEPKNKLTGSALMKLDFDRDYQLNPLISRVYAKELKCTDVTQGFVTHCFPGGTKQSQNSTMANILEHLPHDKNILGGKFQKRHLSFFKRGYYTEKRLSLYLSVPILLHERYSFKLTLFADSMSLWVKVFPDYNVTFLLITTNEINKSAFDTVRKDLETFGVNIHTVDLSNDVKSNQGILIEYLRNLDL